MKALEVIISTIAVSLVVGVLASCGGGGYGGGGGGGGGGGAATLNITIDPDTITLGESATITWNSNGNTCTASGDWAGTKSGDGNEDVTPDATGTFTYSLTCRGGGYDDSDQGSVTLTVEAARAAGLFVGESCCVDAESVDVTVLASQAGDFRMLARGTQVVGAAGKTPMVFDASDNNLTGRRLTGPRAGERLAVSSREARGTILVKDRAAVPQRLDFALPSERSARTASVAALQGSFTTTSRSGYTFTLTVDRNGEVNGADTRGCIVRGVAAAPTSGMSAFRVTLDVSACGKSNGRFMGEAALIAGTANRPASLFLSASNANAAIGWRLSR